MASSKTRKPAKKSAAKKGAAPKKTAKKAAAKAPAKRASAKKAARPVKKVAAKKPAKKVAAKKPAKKVAAKKPAAKKQVAAKKVAPSIEQVLAELDEILRARYPRSYEELGPPADAGTIAEVEKAIGAPLPADLAALYRWKNGADDFWSSKDDDDYDAGWDWLALEDALAVRAQFLELIEMADLPEGSFPAHWLPIATNGAGDFHCYVLPASGERRAGAIVAYWHEAPEEREVAARSLAAWLAPIVDRAKKDLFHDGREDLDPAARRARSEALFAEAKRRLDDGTFAYDDAWIHGSAFRLHTWGDNDLARALARAGVEATQKHPILAGNHDMLMVRLRPFYAVERSAAEALGDLDAVMESTTRIAEGAPPWIVPREWESAARIFAAKGDWSRALEAIDRAIAARDEPLSHARRVVALARLGRDEERRAEGDRAIAALSSAIAADEGTADGALVRAARSVVRALLGDDAGAADDRQAALALEEDAARWVLEGDVLFQPRSVVAEA